MSLARHSCPPPVALPRLSRKQAGPTASRHGVEAVGSVPSVDIHFLAGPISAARAVRKFEAGVHFPRLLAHHSAAAAEVR